MPRKAYRNNLFSKTIFTVVIALGVFMLFQEHFLEKNNLIAYCVLLGAAIWNRMDSRNKAYKASAHFGPINVDLSTGDTSSGSADSTCACDDAAPDSDEEDHRGRRD